MLSYMLPVDDKSTTPKTSLQLNLNGTTEHNNVDSTSQSSSNKYLSLDNRHTTENRLMDTGICAGDIKSNSQHHSILIQHTSSGDSDGDGKQKCASNKLGKGAGPTKNLPLKRVSFGSSKGSMVETLLFETPTPIPEHADREFGFPPTQPLTTNNNSTTIDGTFLDDSGIELQEDTERSKVRVTIYRSSTPQQISPPDHLIELYDTDVSFVSGDYQHTSDISTDNIMASNGAVISADIPPNYNRQISTESGWDNPFRPGGDLSREADEIVNMIKGGKPITPTGDVSNNITINGAAQTNNYTTENGTIVDGVATKTEISQVQSTNKNGTTPITNKTNNSQQLNKSPKNGDASKLPQTQVSNQVIPGPQSASHVVIEGKKQKKCTCCSIQ